MKESFRSRLMNKEILLGTLFTLPSPELAEVLSGTGLDWLFVDLEHSALDIRTTQTVLQAVAGRIDCLLRVPLNDEIWIKKALDIGAAGIIVPQINTASEALQAVRWSKYPPLGTRSVGLGRAQGYGVHLQEYLDRANEEIAVVIQAEHFKAVQNIETIIAVVGIDAILVGPYDLSASMGLVGQIEHPDVQAAILRVQQVCLAKNIPLGIFAASAERAREFLSLGYSLLAVGSDTLMVSQAAKETVYKLFGQER
jgi:2-keto-3-deoxy-L-rhamnonate aldolase RhmA